MCKCIICKKENYVIDTKKFPKDFCSHKCYDEWTKFNKEPNCKCSICGKEMYLKPSRLKRVKNGVCCSKECTYKLKSEYSKGEKNHQFNLTGELNSSFKGSEIEHHFYIYEYCPNHPKSNKNGRVRQHRLVVEKNYTLFNPIYFEEINGQFILKDEYDVHHINEIKSDNSIENLQILTRSEHTSLHNLDRSEIIEKYKKIIGVLKQGELLESLEVDNQQPSLSSNTFEGSETNVRILTDKAEDSNNDTSALLQQIKNIVGDDIVRTIL